MDTAAGLDKLREPAFRQDAIGMYQGLTGLWQIFCRQAQHHAGECRYGSFVAGHLFHGAEDESGAFRCGPAGSEFTARERGHRGSNASGTAHDRVMALLAGTARPDDAEIRTELIRQQQRYFDAQALFAPDTIFELADNLEAVAKGEKLNAQLAARLAAKANDIQLPRASMTFEEKGSQAFGYWVDRHIGDQRKLNLRATDR